MPLPCSRSKCSDSGNSDIDENRCEEKIKTIIFFHIAYMRFFFFFSFSVRLSMAIYRCVYDIGTYGSYEASQTRLFFIRHFSFFILMKLEKSNVIHKFLFTNVMVKMPIVFHSTDIITNLFLKSFNRLIVLVAAVAVSCDFKAHFDH